MHARLANSLDQESRTEKQQERESSCWERCASNDVSCVCVGVIFTSIYILCRCLLVSHSPNSEGYFLDLLQQYIILDRLKSTQQAADRQTHAPKVWSQINCAACI